MKTNSSLAVFASLFLLAAAGECRAQWLTEQIALTPGWNAVYLSVQPSATNCDAVFAGLPVETVWCWNPPLRAAQFQNNPQQPSTRRPDWLYWRPASNPQAFLNSLHWVKGGRAYLVKLAANAAPLTWGVKGAPVLFQREWKGGAMNFTGLPVAANTTSFVDFFGASSAIGTMFANNGQISQVNAAGQGVPVFTPARVQIQPTAAYWILSHDATDYAGSVRVTLDYGSVVTFPAGITVRHVLIRNESAAARTVTVRLLPSESPPYGQSPALAGPVPLSYDQKNYSQLPVQDVYLPVEPGLSQSLAPGATWNLALTPRRAEMTGAGANASFQSLLEISDGATVRQVVGVWAIGASAAARAAARPAGGLSAP